jgi:hypothetical protein
MHAKEELTTNSKGNAAGIEDSYGAEAVAYRISTDFETGERLRLRLCAGAGSVGVPASNSGYRIAPFTGVSEIPLRVGPGRF